MTEKETNMENILGTNTMVQVAIVCHDINKTAKAYAEFFGVEVPNTILTDEYTITQAIFRGKPTKARAKLAFIKVGELINIEIIEPDHEPSTWREDLDSKGEGMHHIAFVMKDLDDMDARVATLSKRGMPLIQRGLSEKGAYSYVDANDDLKLTLELLVRGRKN